MVCTLSPEERRELARLAAVNEQYLYQCLTGRRDMNPGEARRVESAVNGRIMRWHICQKTWHRIWPELIGTDGAPDPAEAEQAEER